MVFFIGVTNDLLRRVIEHKKKNVKGFSQKYNLDKLIWYEQTDDIRIAIQKEKQMKKWYRQYKINVIEENNLEWKDLYYDIGRNEELLNSM